jgi:phosphogluconate dehydratase
VTPLLCRVYPNGKADVNHFHAAGGMGFVIRELLGAGLLHPDVTTSWGGGPCGLCGGADAGGRRTGVAPRGPGQRSMRPSCGRYRRAVQRDGRPQGADGTAGARGDQDLGGGAGDRQVIEAPARIFHDQDSVQLAAFKAGELDRDMVAVVRFQGPRANGMPELHKLMPPLMVAQERGFKVALVTDGGCRAPRARCLPRCM